MCSTIITSFPIVLLLLFVSNTIGQDTTNSLQYLKSLNDVQLKWLHDYVRRGKGSVSRLPFEEIFNENSDPDVFFPVGKSFNGNIEADENVVKITGEFERLTNNNNRSAIISVNSHVQTTTTSSSTTTTTPSPTTTTTPSSTITVASLSTTTTPSQLISALINTPPTTTEPFTRIYGINNGKKDFDFKQLALLLRYIIDKRKGRKNDVIKVTNITNNMREEVQTGENWTEDLKQTAILRNEFTVANLKPTRILYRRVNPSQRPRNRQSTIRSLGTKTTKLWRNYSHTQYNERSNQYSHEILTSISNGENNIHSNINVIPNVSKELLSHSKHGIRKETAIYIIREGSSKLSNENNYELISSITLVIDDKQKILVDTGLGTDIDGRTLMLQRLSELDVLPSSVNYVITTHGHPDHSGNTNDFPDAYHFAGKFMYRRMNFKFSRVFKEDVQKLTKNVYLLKTPGHTSDDISVLVKNTAFFGTVIISGDIFRRKEDMKYPLIWKSFAINETQQQESRRRLLCIGDYIVPGHGALFRVSGSMKQQLNCPQL